MKRLLLVFVLLILLLPIPAMAIGEIGVVEDMISPETGVWWSFLVAVVAIALDTVMGILVSLYKKEFDPRLLPQFLITGVLPFIGGLLVLAILAYYIEVPFVGMFYASAAAIAGKYSIDVWDKLKLLFGITPKVSP